MAEKEERILHIVQKLDGRFVGENRIARTEAIERMAKAAYYNASTAPANFPDWDKIEDEIGKEVKQGFIAFAEAALNALLKGE